MPPSYRTIDYSLRPAKHTERRMLCDIFRKLSVFSSLKDYTYLGFGAIAFSDFILFHKALGIGKMISLEQASGALNRLEKNKPFNAITIINKPAASYLPKLKWNLPHIIWLDYDDTLLPSMFDDLSIIANHANSGTALTFSFQCYQALEVYTNTEDRTPLERFISTFSRERVPPETEETDLTGWSFGKLGGNMLIAEINSILAVRNAALPAEKRIEFHLICNIRYKDGANMYTVAGVFVSAEENEILEKAKFSELEFLPRNKQVAIDMPKLTLREIKFLERQLPLAHGTSLDHSHIPVDDANNFVKLYRYLPNFSVLEN